MTLCRRCGLCCDGTLFSWVTVRPEELPALQAHRLPVLQREDGSHAFRQPCTALNGKDCTVYADRPLPCRQFRCQQLIALEEGEIDLEEALRVVERTREAIQAVVRAGEVAAANDSGTNPVAALRAQVAEGGASQEWVEELRRIEALLARDFLGRARRA